MYAHASLNTVLLLYLEISAPVASRTRSTTVGPYTSPQLFTMNLKLLGRPAQVPWTAASGPIVQVSVESETTPSSIGAGAEAGTGGVGAGGGGGAESGIGGGRK